MPGSSFILPATPKSSSARRSAAQRAPRALPARFRRERILIVGCGDVGMRVAQRLNDSLHMIALTSSPARVPALRALGLVPIQGDLDDARSLQRLAGLATRVLHLAPPPRDASSKRDPRTRSLLRALRRRTAPAALVYGSTSGVYGDCDGALVDETRLPRPATARASRRLDAETAVRRFGRATRVRSTLLRIPGIYAMDREGGTPRERLSKRTPALVPEDDVFTSHIHADDLARACIAALWRGRAQRIVNVCDDTELKAGDWFDLAARVLGLPRPPRIPRAQAQAELSAMQLSFLDESRLLSNRRMKRELRLSLLFPTVENGLAAISVEKL